jgi:Zn-dependent peptidase ImmA (M78 family)
MLVEYLDSALALPSINFPNVEAYGESEIEGAAELCRRHWRLGGDVPILNATRVAETAGAMVTRFAGATKSVDAFSRFGDPRPIIVLNSEKQSSSRSIWDIAHECGHLVLHRKACGRDAQREKEADRFAAAFLLPRAGLMREYRAGSTELAMLFDLKARWRVSVAAILRRAFDLNLIVGAQFLRAYKYLSSRGWRRGEPLEPETEKPETLAVAVQVLKEKHGITPAEIARRLHWSPQLFESVTGMPVEGDNEGNLAQVALFEEFRNKRIL